MRFFESHTDPHVVAEGVARARQAVVRRLDIEPGVVTATLQGRGEPRRTVRMAFQTYELNTWERLAREMAEQTLFAAKLLAGDMPRDVEDIFAPMGLKLFPVDLDEADIAIKDAQQDRRGVVNSDVCCVAAIVAERLDSDPFLIFELRGIEEDEFRERLRQRRALAGAASGLAAAYAPKPIEAAQKPSEALEAHLDEFWAPGKGLADFETPLDRPQVSHALLRRLGPSPFSQGRFPLVGLLATCYDTISEAAIRSMDAAETDSDEDEPADGQHERD